MQKLAKKFVEVMRECAYVAKNGSNDFHRYKYATSADVLSKVNASLTKHGIASVVTPNLLSVQEVTTAKGNIERLATVEVTITLIDSESGESFAIKGIGSGQDAGDKIRYFGFCILSRQTYEIFNFQALNSIIDEKASCVLRLRR